MRCLRVQEFGKRGWSRCHTALEDNHAGAVRARKLGLLEEFWPIDALQKGRWGTGLLRTVNCRPAGDAPYLFHNLLYEGRRIR